MWWLIWPKIQFIKPKSQNVIKSKYLFKIIPWSYTNDLEINGLSVKEILAENGITLKSCSYNVDSGFYPIYNKSEDTVTFRFKNKKEAMMGKIIISNMFKN